MSELVPSNNNEKDSQPSREEVQARVDKYRKNLADADLQINELQERSVGSDAEEATRNGMLKATQKARKNLRDEFAAYVGPELFEAFRAFDEFNQADDRQEGSSRYDKFKEAEANLQAAEEAFYGKYESKETETGHDVEARAEQIKEALATKMEQIDDDTTPEKLTEILINALGATVTESLSGRMRDRLQKEEHLRKIINEMNAENMGATINANEDHIKRLTEMFKNDDAKAKIDELTGGVAGDDATTGPAASHLPTVREQGTLAPQDTEDDYDDDEYVGPLTWKERFMGNARYYASRPWIWLATRNSDYRDRYNNATLEERAKMERKANLIGWLGTAAVAAVGIATKTHMFGMLDGHHGSGGGGIGSQAGEHSPEHSTDVPPLTPEQMSLNSHKVETDFLESNGRVRHDFNNITANEIGVPGDKDHFPGYTALHEQYQKSPSELAAQIRQIEVIEQANGHSGFDALPQDLHIQPGESHDAYITRLSNAIYDNDDLHNKLNDQTLDYIKVHGQPLQDLNSAYSSDYMIIENGKPTVQLDQYVESADPNDKILLLSPTKGIRFPCGQPIEILPSQPTVEAPVVHPAAATIIKQPGVTPEAPATPVTPIVPETPSVPTTPVTPEVPQVPEVPQIPEVPTNTAPKQTPQVFADNPFSKPVGSGNYEDIPAHVTQSTIVNGVTEQAHTNGGAAANVPSGIHAPAAANHDTSAPAGSNVNAGVQTPGVKVGNH